MHPYERDVSSKYGAPMGRDSDDSSELEGKRVHLHKVPMVDDCYDPGGAYWGLPANLYCAWSNDGDDEIVCYFRASNRKGAINELPECEIVPAERASLTESEIDSFVRDYVVSALWSSRGEDEEPLDKDYSFDDIAPETIAEMRRDCERFLRENLAVIGDFPLSDVAHDFWMTRNGRGCGFWDGDYPEPQASILTRASKKFGEVDLYVGDDGLIYQG